MDIPKLIRTLLLPKFCAVCGIPGSALCQNCSKRIEPIRLQYCIICDRYSTDGTTHKVCSTKLAPDKLLSAFIYNGAVKKIILKSKFGQRSFKLLDILIFSRVNFDIIEQIPLADIITPVPMASKLLNHRLINHSEYISSKIADILKKSSTEILGKKRFSKSQKRFSKNFRFQNIKGEIFLKNKKIKIKEKRVLLVDDVATTGATLIESAKILKINGAAKVYCYTLAKDLRYNDYNIRHGI